MVKDIYSHRNHANFVIFYNQEYGEVERPFLKAVVRE